MTPNRLRSRPTIETPIERIFRSVMRRPMTKLERRLQVVGMSDAGASPASFLNGDKPQAYSSVIWLVR
jgi:hypothetical protein